MSASGYRAISSSACWRYSAAKRDPSINAAPWPRREKSSARAGSCGPPTRAWRRASSARRSWAWRSCAHALRCHVQQLVGAGGPSPSALVQLHEGLQAVAARARRLGYFCPTLRKGKSSHRRHLWPSSSLAPRRKRRAESLLSAHGLHIALCGPRIPCPSRIYCGQNQRAGNRS